MENLNLFKRCRDSVYNGLDQFLLAKIAGSEQENDLSFPPNCNGYGRKRHFHRELDEDWYDSLPMDPMSKSLNLKYSDVVEAQVFQIASCNLRCWYCFVPDNLKQGAKEKSCWFTADSMVDMFVETGKNIRLMDLSGGNPELVPEWIFETMRALEKRGLRESVYLWSDDALTTDYFFRYLDSNKIEYIKNYPHYGKVGCFKGFDDKSFCFNTNLNSNFYNQQFELFKRYLDIGLDMYGYVTMTTDDVVNLEERISLFIDKLKKIHPLLPLRVVPLKIVKFTPVSLRVSESHLIALDNQVLVYREWRKQLRKNYSEEQINQKICDVVLL